MIFKLFVLATSLTGLIACGSTPVVKPDLNLDPKPGLGASSEVSGQADDWTPRRAGVFRAIVSRTDSSLKFTFAVLAQGSIDGKGKLGLKLINAPEAVFLTPYEVCGLKTEANAVETSFDVAEIGFETDGSKRYAVLAQRGQEADATRVYLDRNLEIDAKCTEDGAINAKLSLKKGWNLVLKTFTQPGNTGAVYSNPSGVAGVPFTVVCCRP
jgi:hypothetical protein